MIYQILTIPLPSEGGVKKNNIVDISSLNGYIELTISTLRRKLTPGPQPKRRIALEFHQICFSLLEKHGLGVVFSSSQGLLKTLLRLLKAAIDQIETKGNVETCPGEHLKETESV